MKILTKGLMLSTALLLVGLSCVTAGQVLAATPNFTAIFSPSTIGPGSISTLTYTIDNTAESAGVSGLGFSNTLPGNVTLATPVNALTDCTDGSFTAADGGTVVTMSNYREGAGQSCTLVVDVTSATVGTHTNTTGSLASSAGDAGTATDDLVVDASRPGFSVAFSPATITPRAISTLTYTINNTANGALARNLTINDTLPAGMTIASDPNAVNSCFSSVSAVPGSSAFSTSDGRVAAGASCTLAFDVTVDSAGIYDFTTAELSSHLGSSGKAAATLTATSAFIFAAFPAAVTPGSSVILSYTMTNTDRGNSATSITFSNDLNATLSGLAATALPADGFCGAGSTINGSSLLTVSGASLSPEASCTFDVTVLIPAGAAAGTYANNTSILSMDLGSATTKPAASNDLVVKLAPTLSMAFIDDPASAGDDVTLRFVITNTDPAATVIGLAFSQAINTIYHGTVVKTLPNANACGTGSTFDDPNNGGPISFVMIDGTLAAAASCTFDVILTLPSDGSPGAYDFTTSNITGTVAATTLTGSTATDTLLVIAAPSLVLAIVEDAIVPGGTVTLDFTLGYSANAAADVTDVAFSLDLDGALSGLLSTTATQTDICGSGSTLSGSSSLSLSGATLAVDSSCTFSVTLQIPVAAAPGVITLTSSTITGTTSGAAVSKSAGTDSLTISGLTFSKLFIGDPVLPGATISLQYTIDNAATALAASDMVFTDSLSAVVASLSATTWPSDPCGVGSSISGTTFLIFTGGTLAAGESCTFSVTVLVPGNATANDYFSVSSQLSATVNGNNTANPAATDGLIVEQLTIALSTSAGDPTDVTPIPVSIDFSRPVVNFVVTDLTLTNASAANFAGSGTSYTVELIPDGDAIVTVDVAAGVADDAVDGSVSNPAASQLSLEYNTAAVIPTPSLSLSAPSISATSTGPVTYTVTYSDAATVNLTAAAVTLNSSGATATVTVTDGDTASATVTLSNIGGDGSLGISIAAETARNGTNLAPAVGPSATFSVDNTQPIVTITDAVADPFNSTFTATFTFDENVTGFALEDISAGNATLSAFNAASTTVYSVLVTPTSQGAVTLDVAADVALDAVNNGNAAASQHSLMYDSITPTTVISGATAPVNAPFSATVTFNEDVSGFAMADITATNASLSTFATTSASVYTVIVTPIADGSVTLDVAADAAVDTAANANNAAAQYSVSYDTVQPTVVIRSTGDPVNGATTATFTFSEAVSGFDLVDISAGNATLSAFSTTNNSVYTVTVTPAVEGDFTLDLAAAVANDTAGNANTAASQLTIGFDITLPTVGISAPAGPVNAAFTATVTFSEAVVNFIEDDIIVVNASLSDFTAVSAMVYTVTVTPTTDGDVTLDIAAGVAVDSATNGNSAADQLSVSHDATLPTVDISAPAGTVNAAFISTVTFSEAVVNFIEDDIIVVNASLSDFTAVSAMVYTVTVTPTTDGPVTLDVAADVAIDSATNGNSAANQLSVGFDTRLPTVDISGPTGAVNAAFTATVTFSEAVVNFIEDDIIVVNASLSDFTAVSAMVYTVTVTPTTDGPVTLDVAADVAIDSATNGNSASAQYQLTFDATTPVLTIDGPTEIVNTSYIATFTFSEAVSGFTGSDIRVIGAVLSNLRVVSANTYNVVVTPITFGEVVLEVAANVAQDSAGNGNNADSLRVSYDATPPRVELQGPTGMVNGAFVLQIVFSENVSGFELGDLSVTNVSLSEFLTISPSAYAVTVTPQEDGIANISIDAGVAVDLGNNANLAAVPYSVTYDGSAPGVVISGPDGVTSSEFEATLTFSSDVSGFTVSDVVVTNATVSDFTLVSAAVYTVKVTPAAEGLITLNIKSDSAFDLADNGNIAAQPYSVTYDHSGPGLSIGGPDSQVDGPFTATFAFSEAVSGFEQSDIVVVNATVSAFAGQDEQNYSVLITPLSSGTVSINVAADVALDSAGNGNAQASEYAVIADFGALHVTLSGPVLTNQPFTMTIAFSGDVSGFVESDISLVNADLSAFNAVSAAAYTVLVSPVDEGAVRLSLAAGVAVDNLGKGNQPSNILTVNYDSLAPLVAVFSPADNDDISLVAVNLSLTFDEAVNAQAADKLSIELFEVGNDMALESLLVSAAEVVVSDKQVKVTTPFDLVPGAYFIQISAGAFADEAGNLFAGIMDETSWNFTVADRAPVAVDDQVMLNEDNSVEITLLDNDSDAEGQLDASSVVLQSSPVNGTAQLDGATGTVSYTPHPNFSGSDSLTYTVSDRAGIISNVATVTITVTEVNDAPVAADDSSQTGEDIALNIDVLANDNDVDDGINSSTLTIFAAPANGVALVVNGQISYTPAANFSGSDSFRYNVQDNSGATSNLATVTLVVSSVVDLPVAVDDAAHTDEDIGLSINLLANDQGVDSVLDPVSVIIETAPGKGTVTLDAQGVAAYQPAQDYFGNDSFSYSVADVNGNRSAAANVVITVLSVNDVPLITSVAPLTADPATIYVYQLLATDADGDSLTIAAEQLPAWLSFDGNDSISGIPSIEHIGQTFDVILSVSDNVIAEPLEQGFSVTVAAPEKSLLLLSQTTSENPVLVGSNLALTYTVVNKGPADVLLDTLTIELTGTFGVFTLPGTCTASNVDAKDVISCDLSAELLFGESIDTVLSLPVTGLGSGEIQSQMSLTSQSPAEAASNRMLVIVAEEIVDEEGEVLAPSTTADSAFGDVNNDGLADLVIVNRGGQANQVLFNTGGGEFVPSSSFGEGSDSRALALADLDNDDALDIIVANSGNSASGYYLNNGDGSFGSLIELGKMRSTGVSVADFNSDGLIDIVFGNGKAVGNKVFIQPFDITESGDNVKLSDLRKKAVNGVAKQAPTALSQQTETGDTFAVNTGDFNGDGFVDIVIGYDDASLEVLFNDGNGSFTSVLSEGVDNVAVIAISDINSDGHDDIFISYPPGNGVILGGQSLGSEVLSIVNLISAVPAADIGIADVDQDGILDVMLVNNPGGITTYHFDANSQDPASLFVRDEVVIATQGSDGLALADLDGDGDIDMIVTAGGETVSDEILFNAGSGGFGAQTVDLSTSLVAAVSVTEQASYEVSILVANKGPGIGDNVVLDYGIDNGELLSFDSSTLACELLLATQLQCTLAEMTPGSEHSLMVTVRAAMVGTVAHRVSISNERSDDVSDNNQASADTKVNSAATDKRVKNKGGGSVPLGTLLLLTALWGWRRDAAI